MRAETDEQRPGDRLQQILKSSSTQAVGSDTAGSGSGSGARDGGDADMWDNWGNWNNEN